MAELDLQTRLRREALQGHASGEMDSQDDLDIRDAGGESPQEMHERMLAEDSGEETLDLLESLRELQGGELVTWKVWRIAGPNGEPLRSGPSEYCAELGNTQLTMQNLASLFGGGKYRVKGRYASGKIAGGRTITIAADAKRNEEPMAAMAGGASSSFNMSEFLAMQQHQDQVREERFEKRMLTLASICAPILTAFIGRPANAAPDVAALITALRPSVMPPDSSTQMKNTLETMVMMKKIMGGGSDDSDSLVEIVKAVAPHAGPALEALAANRNTTPAHPHMRARVLPPGVQPTQPIAPKVVQAPPISSQPQPVVVHPTPHTGVDLNAPSQPFSQDDRNMFAQLKPQVDSLVTMAQQGADPIECATVFCEITLKGADDPTYDKLCQFFDNEKAIDQISIFNTGVKDQRPFFEAFQKRVLEWIVAEDEAAQSTAGSNPASA